MPPPSAGVAVPGRLNSAVFGDELATGAIPRAFICQKRYARRRRGMRMGTLGPSAVRRRRAPSLWARERSSSQPAMRIWGWTTSTPSPDRAVETSRRPELTRPRLPLARCQSRTRHFAGIPRSTSARTAGQASRVVTKRPTILLEGISRSEYPTSPMNGLLAPETATSGGRTDPKRRDHRERHLCDPGQLHRSRRRLEPEPGDAVGAETAFLVTGRASERSPLRPESSPTAGMRGRAGIPAADSANSTRKSPVVMTYRPSSGAPSSGALHRRKSPVGSTPRRIAARAANRGASLVGDSSPIRRPSASSSQ